MDTQRPRPSPLCVCRGAAVQGQGPTVQRPLLCCARGPGPTMHSCAHVPTVCVQGPSVQGQGPTAKASLSPQCVQERTLTRTPLTPPAVTHAAAAPHTRRAAAPAPSSTTHAPCTLSEHLDTLAVSMLVCVSQSRAQRLGGAKDDGHPLRLPTFELR